MIVAEFTIIPMGSGTSASKYVEAVYELLKESGMKYMPGPLSTAVETDSFENLFQILEEANRKLANMGVRRIITSVHIDYRLDKGISIDSKMSISKKF
jgi:uncharacterized protein (TIGR00106 family)